MSLSQMNLLQKNKKPPEEVNPSGGFPSVKRDASALLCF
jgi:hypothetical protein